MAQIIPGVYLGCVNTATNRKFIIENNIDVIYSIITEKEMVDSIEDNNIEKIITNECVVQLKYNSSDNIINHNVMWKQYEITDTNEEQIDKYFETIYTDITGHITSGKNILVHCKEGISRSATIIAAFLMQRNKISRKEAIEFISKIKPNIDPNDGFMDKLKSLEYKILH